MKELERIDGEVRLTEWADERALGVDRHGAAGRWRRLAFELRKGEPLRLMSPGHPCLVRVRAARIGRASVVVDGGACVTLADVLEASRVQGGVIEPELLACIVGRAGLGVEACYEVVTAPVRGVVADNILVFDDGQVRFDPLGQLRPAAPALDDARFGGGPPAPGESAPFPVRGEEADVFALMDTLHRAMTGQPLTAPSAAVPKPIARLAGAALARETQTGSLATELLLWAERRERDIAGLVRGLCGAALEQQAEQLAELALFSSEPVRQPEVPALDASSVVGGVRADCFPVSCGRYAAFCASTGHAPPASWSSREAPADREDHPVVEVGVADAQAFAAWDGGRLPDDEEWSALTGGARVYPYGVRFDERCGDRAFLEPVSIRETRPLGQHAFGKSPVGIYDLCQIWEITAEPAPHGWSVRGGPWRDRAAPGAVDHRSHDDRPARDVGFRLVRERE